nr:hypothetical protein BDOA9_0146710 [Bradyrhizobium sp. DOA9]
MKPNIRPSLRSGLTAYVALSSGSDALLPPSPCGWLTLRARSGATSPQALAHRPRAPGPHDFAVRETAPVVCAQPPAHGVTRPANQLRATRPASTTSHPAFVTIAMRPSARVGVAATCANSEFE